MSSSEKVFTNRAEKALLKLKHRKGNIVMKSLLKTVLLVLVLGFSTNTPVVADTDITHSVTQESTKVYLISGAAFLDNGDGTATIRHRALLIKANSLDESIRRGRASLLEVAPPSKGWRYHGVDSNEISDASLADLSKK